MMMLRKVAVLTFGVAVLSILLAYGLNDDAEKFNEYHRELGEYVEMYATNAITKEELTNFLDEFELFLNKAKIDEEVREKQLTSIRLYKEGLSNKDANKITKAAFLSYEAHEILNAN